MLDDRVVSSGFFLDVQEKRNFYAMTGARPTFINASALICQGLYMKSYLEYQKEVRVVNRGNV